jgi:hypothetical protein
VNSPCLRYAILPFVLCAAASHAQETLLVCEGLTIETSPGVPPEALEHEISIVLYDDYVEVSDTGEALYSVHEGIVWVWRRALGGEDYVYNLDTISGRLRAIVSPASGLFDDRKINRILSYQCSKVSERLVR